MADTSKDKLDLLGDDEVEVFSGSLADLEGAADNLFSSPRPQPLRFETLSLKIPQTVPPTPGMALRNKNKSKLEKRLGAHFNIPLPTTNGSVSGFHA